MPRTFAYVRVSTTGQTTENQIQEIEAAGFHVEPRRIVTETVSGSTAIAQRRGFSRLMDKLESGDILIVTKLDRLGRDAIDVSTTVRRLTEMGVRVYCLALGGADLTSSAGTMTMNVLNAVAQFERDLLIERTQSGLKRAKSEGKALGRPSTLNEKQKQDVRDDLAKEMSVSAIGNSGPAGRPLCGFAARVHGPFDLSVRFCTALVPTPTQYRRPTSLPDPHALSHRQRAQAETDR
jgi:putative DNA-invertase from lambdoid prophage Rac